LGTIFASTDDSSISTARNFLPVSYVQLGAALLIGFALRLFFIFKFAPYSGDTKFYEELARNWLYHGVYGLFVRGQLSPVDMRMPGYPAFLAAVYAVFGRSDKAVTIVQAVIDMGTCVLTAAIAACLAPHSRRRIAATVALWLAALCPFTANYSAIVLTEVLATFLTTLALLFFARALGDRSIDVPPRALERRALLYRAGLWLGGGFIIGIGTLVRPEAPLLLVAVVFALGLRWWRRADWSKLALAVLWMVAGLLLVLAPWAARNAITLGRIEFLAPRYAETKGDYIPRGFYEWTRTWMVQFGEAYLVTWKLEKAPIRIESLPSSAFDSAAERARVDALLRRYNSELNMTPVLDHEFALLAGERTARHPIRTYFVIPVYRAWMIWFTPRIELLPYSGKLWPMGEKWRGNPTDFDVTLGFGILNCVYLVLAFVGAWRSRRNPALALLIAFIVARTALLTQLQTVEPRYVIVCFPAILALGALAFTVRQQDAADGGPQAPALAHAIRNGSGDVAG
jgi:4-amino-4-deoxy-L-arabinose transferase-like glycosyltransferase